MSQSESAAGPEAMAIAEHAMRIHNEGRNSSGGQQGASDLSQLLTYSMPGISTEQIDQTVEHLHDMLASVSHIPHIHTSPLSLSFPL